MFKIRFSPISLGIRRKTTMGRWVKAVATGGPGNSVQPTLLSPASNAAVTLGILSPMNHSE